MNILNILKERFDVVTPIFERDVLALGYSIDDINETLEENVFERVKPGVQGFDFGNIYVLPQYSQLFDSYSKIIDELRLIKDYFIGKNFEFGYFSGIAILNVLGLCNQMFLSQEIFSSRVMNDIRLTVDNVDIVIKPLNEAYNRENVFNLMFSDALNRYKEYFDNDWRDSFNRLLDKGLVSSDILQMINEEGVKNEIRELFTRLY